MGMRMLKRSGSVNREYWWFSNALTTMMQLESKSAPSCSTSHSSATAASAFATDNFSEVCQHNLLHAFTQC